MTSRVVINLCSSFILNEFVAFCSQAHFRFQIINLWPSKCVVLFHNVVVKLTMPAQLAYPGKSVEGGSPPNSLDLEVE